jgi:hypothetical protein
VTSDDAIQQARERLAELGLNLQKIMTPLDVAGLLCGAATGVLLSTFGPAKAAEYFNELAANIGRMAAERTRRQN